MPNRGNFYAPDFYPDDPVGWQDFGPDQQVDIRPAVGAFKQRFMSKQPSQPTTGLHEMDHAMGDVDMNGIAPTFTQKKGGSL